MIWLLLVILLIVAIVAISRSGKKNRVEMQKFQSEIEKNNATPPPNISVSDEITKLKKLFDDGVLTQEEFDSRKKKLLDI